MARPTPQWIRPRLAIVAAVAASSCAAIEGLDGYGPGSTGGDSTTDAPIASGDASVEGATSDGPVAEGAVDDDALSDALATADASALDAWPTDASKVDAPPADAGTPDAGTPDAGTPDTGTADARAADADAGHGPTCTGDLSNIGTGDFRISFTLTTQSNNREALLNQRSVCTSAMFWDLRMVAASGHIQLEISDGTNYFQGEGNIAVNNGLARQLVFARTSGTLTLQVDGAASTFAGGAAPFVSFGALPPLENGIDPCDNIDGTMPLVGTITQVCVGP